MKIISWNMSMANPFLSTDRRREIWRNLLDLDIDLALLQEAGEPPSDVSEQIQADPVIEVDAAPWETWIVGGRPKYRTAIVKLSDRVKIERIDASRLETANSRGLVASWPGTLAAARVTPPSGEPLIAVSMYAPWV